MSPGAPVAELAARAAYQATRAAVLGALALPASGGVPDLAALPDLPPDPTRVLYLGGLGRSGSTLLELVLGQSSQVCALGEVVHLWSRALRGNERCGCGERFTGCAFWQAVGERAFGGWSAVDPDEVLALQAQVDRTRHIPALARRRLPAGRRAAIARYADYYTRIYAAAAAVSGAAVVVDSSKHASLAFALSRADDLDLRVVHLVRDSRAVAYSWGKRVRRPEVVDAEAYMPQFSAARVAALWTTQNAAFGILRRLAPVTRLRYEDFTADPIAAISQIRAFAGLPEDPAALTVLTKPATAPRPIHSIAGNPLRFAAAPLRIRADEAWRTALPRRARWLVGAATLPLSLAYGYGGTHPTPGEPPC